ncbi:MAG: CHAP domain-containing protein [Candidatus Berkelbacteria bacterium]
MEVIICTPNLTSGTGSLDDHICQETFTTESLTGSQRGQSQEYQGDAPKTKRTLKQKQNTIKKISTISGLGSKINQKITPLSPFRVGGFVALVLVLSLFVNAPKAQAASLNWSGAKLAQVVADVYPVVAPQTQTVQAQAPVDTSDDFIEKPIVTETQITPVDPPRVLGTTYRREPVDYSLVTGPHYFPYGYCTYYVSQKRTVTWTGNAGTWLSGAKSAGLTTGDEPQPGAIVVTSEGGRVGHVAYVEAVNNGKITISEMNFKGYGVVSTRTISDNAKFIKGYIY